MAAVFIGVGMNEKYCPRRVCGNAVIPPVSWAVRASKTIAAHNSVFECRNLKKGMCEWRGTGRRRIISPVSKPARSL